LEALSFQKRYEEILRPVLQSHEPGDHHSRRLLTRGLSTMHSVRRR